MFSFCFPSSRGFRRGQRGGRLPTWRYWVSAGPCRLWRFPQRTSKDEHDCIPVLGELCRVGTLKAGKLEKLVDHLVPSLLLGDPNFVSTFLCVYRKFATTQQVLDLLFARYGCILPFSSDCGGPKDQLRTAISIILASWLDQHAEDFCQPPDFPCLKLLLAYLNLNMPGSDLDLQAQHLLNQLETLQRTLSEVPLLALEHIGEPEWNSCDTHELDPCPVLDPSGKPFRLFCVDTGRGFNETSRFLAFPRALLAEQLTRMDMVFFKNMAAYQSLEFIQDKKDQEHPAPTIHAIITQSNKVSSCVVTTCLGNQSMKAPDRACVIEHWIKVATHCETLKNLSSLHAIISALQSKAIQRLKKTWKEVSRDSFYEFERLSKNFSPGSNHALHREQLPQGTVPYLGTFLAELEKVNKEMPDFQCGRIINVEKLRKQYQIISELKRLQASCNTVNMKPDERFRAWFEGLPRLSETESFRLACELEPPSHSVKKGKSTNPRRGLFKGWRNLQVSNPGSRVSSNQPMQGKTCAMKTCA
ncbi:ral guanine nucleotide dissociation stimulator-like [Dipodomys merriami]|uniref:ral guanine nucleotide dissociation stimulator-like n=1 Tax=Dipodomys merriami TaxID=94247 RepID=UPI003855987F